MMTTYKLEWGLGVRDWRASRLEAHHGGSKLWGTHWWWAHCWFYLHRRRSALRTANLLLTILMLFSWKKSGRPNERQFAVYFSSFLGLWLSGIEFVVGKGTRIQQRHHRHLRSHRDCSPVPSMTQRFQGWRGQSNKILCVEWRYVLSTRVTLYSPSPLFSAHIETIRCCLWWVGGQGLQRIVQEAPSYLKMIQFYYYRLEMAFQENCPCDLATSRKNGHKSTVLRSRAPFLATISQLLLDL